MNVKEILTGQQTDDILHVLDDAIAKGPWEKSNFLKEIGKSLLDIRTNFDKQVKASHKDADNMQHVANQVALSSGMQEVYISLYSFDGSNLQSWERILVNLPKQIISRPIYTVEEDAKLLIKTKEKQVNEAYVSIYINSSDIITMDQTKASMDKLGKVLLTIKDNSLRLENVHRFVHLSGAYEYSGGQLKLES